MSSANLRACAALIKTYVSIKVGLWLSPKMNTDRVFQTRSVSQHRFLLEAQHYISEQHAVHLYSGNLPGWTSSAAPRCPTREGVVPRICSALPDKSCGEIAPFMW